MTKASKTPKTLKYAVGQTVSYIIGSKHYFDGVIIEAEIKRGLKPYTLQLADGQIKYANEEYIKAI